MKQLYFEVLMQVAIKTLEKDLNLPSEQIERFKEHFNSNLYQASETMLKNAMDQQENFKRNKFNKYIQN